jgi:hypothetical protein
MASTVDLRVHPTAAEFPEEGLYKSFTMCMKVDVPALITAGTLAATGLVSGNTYKLFNLPKYSIVQGAFIFVRTVDAGGGTITVNTAGGATPTLCTTLSLATAGIVIDSSGAGWTIANISKYNTGGGTDYVAILIGTANVTTAIFDVVVEAIKGDHPFNAGSTGTGQ